MTDSLISIVIPCFNAEAYVGEAIESALAQTYRNTEVIVIDDGSTDDALAVVRSFGDRVQWESGPNRGACAARNRGIDLSRGELIQFLDADDLLASNKLTRQLPIVMSDKGTLVFCDGRYATGLQHPHHARVDLADDPVVFMLDSGLQTSAPLFRKSWIEEVGGWDEGLPCSQERDLLLRIATLGVRFRRLPEILYTVRQVEGSVSSDYAQVLEQHERIGLRILQMLEANGGLTERRRRALAAFFSRDARHLLRLGESSIAKRFFDHAWMAHPSGGLNDAYGCSSRWLRQIIGASATEMASGCLRRLKRFSSRKRAEQRKALGQ